LSVYKFTLQHAKGGGETKKSQTLKAFYHRDTEKYRPLAKKHNEIKMPACQRSSVNGKYIKL